MRVRVCVSANVFLFVDSLCAKAQRFYIGFARWPLERARFPALEPFGGELRHSEMVPGRDV